MNPFQSEEMVTPFLSVKPKFHKKDEPHVCSVYIYTDPFLWRQMYKLQGNKLLQPITITDHESLNYLKGQCSYYVHMVLNTAVQNFNMQWET